MFLLNFQSFVSCFWDPQACHSFSLFCVTGSNCLVLLRLISKNSNVWLVFSLVILLDSGFLLICETSKEWIVVSDSKLTLLSDVTCCSNSLFVLCAFNMALVCCFSSASNLLSYWLFWLKLLIILILQFFFSFAKYFQILIILFLVFSHIFLQSLILCFQFYVIFCHYFLHTLFFFQYYKFLYLLFFICHWTDLHFAEVSIT